MKILFIGTVLFSKIALEKLIKMNYEIVGIVCKRNSDFNDDFYDLGKIARRNRIKYLYTNNINSEDSENWMKSLKPDIIYCFGWSQILKENILNIAKKGVVGFHPAQIPNNRGRHPIIWALFLGLTKTASTFFIMDKGADTGDIISQKIVKIGENETSLTLYNKICRSAIKQIECFTKEIEQNKHVSVRQDKKKGNYWRKRNKNDGYIDWRMTSKAIYNLVRALTRPYAGAHITIQNKDYKVWKVKIIKNNLYNTEPGKVIKKNLRDKTMIIKTYDGAIKLIEHDIDNIKKIGEYMI